MRSSIQDFTQTAKGNPGVCKQIHVEPFQPGHSTDGLQQPAHPSTMPSDTACFGWHGVDVIPVITDNHIHRLEGFLVLSQKRYPQLISATCQPFETNGRHGFGGWF